MGNFFAELKRRHIYRIGAAYAVVAWVLLQLVNNLAPALNLPGWAVSLVVVLLLAGFPIALIFAWTLELRTPSEGKPANTNMDFVLAGALLAVIGIFIFQQMVPAPGAGTAQQANVASNVALAPGANSIAVLPFGNLSGDAAQEFFSDGMTEEITSALAKVPDLQVVARASAFQFKGEKKDMRAVGQALGARYLIDGSVRKAGNRVRITAQLIRADSGVNVWSDSYDRELTDVFATQEEIATAIAGALRVPLGLGQGNSLVRDRTRDLETYDQYLRAKVLLRARGSDVTQAVAILEQVVARDPAFAPAWGLLAQAYVTLPNFSPVMRGSAEEMRQFFESATAKVEMAAREAMRLDPRSAIAYAALARVRSRSGKYADAENLFKQALVLDPSEPEVLYNYSGSLAAIGRLKDAIGVDRRLGALEPFVPNYDATLAMHMVMAGQTQAAIAILEKLPAGAAGGYYRNVDLAEAYAALGRYADAAETLLAIPQPNQVSQRQVEDAARLLRTAPAKIGTPQDLPDLDSLSFVYAFIGAENRLLDWIERISTQGAVVNSYWFPSYAPARKTERFKAYVRSKGLVDYWRARGWPDLCRPMGTDDFVCD